MTNTTKAPRKTKEPMTTSQLMAAWLSVTDKVEVSTKEIAARIVADLSLTKEEVAYLYPAPKGDEKQDNRRVSIFDYTNSLVTENIVVDGKRILPATVAALRDKNVAGETLLQGIPKSVSDKTNWKGQIATRTKTLKAAIERHLAMGETKTMTRNQKSDADFMLSHLQPIFNRANKKETFDLCDVPTFNAWVEQGAKMLGVKLAKVK